MEMIIGILGILKAGGAYVPVDPAYPADRISYMLEDTAATIILTNKATKDKLSESAAKVIELDSDWTEIAKRGTTEPAITIQPTQLAYVIYTSGSTGRPKGVLIEHGSVVNLIITQTAFFDIKSDERILQNFQLLYFDASVEQIFLALFNGAALIMFPEGLQLDTALFEEFLDKQEISHLHAIPIFLEGIQPKSYRQLKRVIAGGDVYNKKLADVDGMRRC